MARGKPAVGASGKGKVLGFKDKGGLSPKLVAKWDPKN